MSLGFPNPVAAMFSSSSTTSLPPSEESLFCPAETFRGFPRLPLSAPPCAFLGKQSSLLQGVWW